MITEEKIKEFKKQLSRGLPAGEIREVLEREGYSQEDINKVFTAPPADMRSWYLTFGIVFLLAGLWAKGGLLFVFSAGLFVQYYRETKRLEKNKKM